MGIQTSAWMVPVPVWTASTTQQGSTVKGAQMVTLVMSAGECPGSACLAPALCPSTPTILPSRASGEVVQCSVFVKKTMQEVTVKGVHLVTMETPYWWAAPVGSVTAVETRTLT